MSALLDSNPALYGAVMWHMASMLPRLRQMKWGELQALADQANKHSLEFPLHMAGPKDRFDVPLWSGVKLSGAQCIALMVAALWVLCGEDEQKAEPLVRAWPISKEINGGRKTIYLGLFQTAHEAHAAYAKSAPQIHGEFARLA